jgi:5-amino-6-(5-phospho-D-ribitylamino)uracil phosphatase
MNLEAIIFDLDGTAMPSESEALPNDTLISAVKDNKERIHLCAATGRSWPKAEGVIKLLGLTDPCIISGGSQIIEPSSEKIIWELRIDLADALAVQDLAKDYNYPVAYADGLTTEYAESISDIEINSPLNTIYILNVPIHIADKLIEQLSIISAITVSRAYSWKLDGGVDLHITNNEATKEHAVAELCDILGVDRSKVAGVGDGFNDIHLFNAVGYKVAMGNAVPELKEAADIVIGEQKDNGLATFIRSAENA